MEGKIDQFNNYSCIRIRWNNWIYCLVVIDSIFLWIGTKIARIDKASFGKAILAVIIMMVLSAILGSALGPLGFIGILLSFLVTLWVVKTWYDTSWGKAFWH